MHEVEVNELSSSTNKLLKNIESLLKENNELLRQALPMSNSNMVETDKNSLKPNVDTMSRKELIEVIKTLPQDTIKGKYMTLPIEELRKQVKEVTK